MDKTVITTFCPGSTYSRCSVWQWDTGLQLCIKGLDLTDPPRVHWGRLGEYTAMELDSTLEDGVVTCQIPDELIAQDAMADYTVDAWVHVVDETAGRTIRAVQVTVKSRAKPDGYVSTPTEAKTWDTVTATAEDAKNAADEAKSVADEAKSVAGGKADSLVCSDSKLSLKAGDTTLSEVTIESGGVTSVNGKTGEIMLSTAAVPTPKEIIYGSDVEMELNPNTLYIFPEPQSLTYSLLYSDDADYACEYHFMFASGETATEINHPSGLYIGDFTVEANKIYEVSIVEGLLIYQSWEAGATT